MHSYEDRIWAVELYYRYGKKTSAVVRELGYPSTKQLSRWVRIYEQKDDLPRDLKRKRPARAVLTGMCYSVGSMMRQGSSSLTWLTGQSAITSSTWRR